MSWSATRAVVFENALVAYESELNERSDRVETDYAARKILEQTSDYERFLAALRRFEAAPQTNLPPALDENGECIDGFYVLEEWPLGAYIFREAERAICVVFFDAENKPSRLREALKLAVQALAS